MELEENLGKCLVWAFQGSTQVECFRAQELGSLVLGYFLEFPLVQESRPRSQVEVVLSLESQGLGPLEASSLASLLVTPSKHPSCQVVMDCPTPMENCPMEWLVPGAKPATQRGQGSVLRRQLQRLKQLSMVLELLGSSLALEGAAFLVAPAQFLGLEASQGLGLPRQQQQLLQRQLLRLPSMELLEA